MKQIYTILVAVLITASVWAQAPEKMSYQAVIRDASNNLVTNTSIGMQISILQGSATGTAVYVETQNPTSNDNGLVSIEIGTGTVVSGDFSSINWASDSYFIKTEIDPSGGTNYTITSTSQLLSVPYALHAKTADSITGGISETDPVFTAWDKNYADLINKPAAISDFTMDANAQNITNLADPVNAQDAATKAYIDNKFDMLIAVNNGVTDIDGNHYDVVIIGDQVWMAEDLRVTHYPNGDPIPYIDDNTAWGALLSDDTSDAFTFYGDNNNDGNIDIAYPDYGALYSYAAAIGDNWMRENNPGQGVCPDGWHLPTHSEWVVLIDYLGGASIAGGKLKEIGTNHWNNPNTGANNSSGFTAIPEGYRRSGSGNFYGLGDFVFFWSADVNVNNTSSALGLGLMYDTDDAANNSANSKNYGCPIRCIKD